MEPKVWRDHAQRRGRRRWESPANAVRRARVRWLQFREDHRDLLQAGIVRGSDVDDVAEGLADSDAELMQARFSRQGFQLRWRWRQSARVGSQRLRTVRVGDAPDSRRKSLEGAIRLRRLPAPRLLAPRCPHVLRGCAFQCEHLQVALLGEFQDLGFTESRPGLGGVLVVEAARQAVQLQSREATGLQDALYFAQVFEHDFAARDVLERLRRSR